jgi:hypothetical protein
MSDNSYRLEKNSKLSTIDLKAHIEICRSGIKDNITDFDDMMLSMETYYHLQERNQMLREAFAMPLKQRVIILEDILNRDQMLLKRLDVAWLRGREYHRSGAPKMNFGMLDEEDIIPMLREVIKYSLELLNILTLVRV